LEKRLFFQKKRINKMANSDFLANIRLALEGKEQVVSGLQQVQQSAQQLGKTKITTTFDKEGLATGKQIEETFAKTATGAKKATPFIDQFGKAMARALIVAPVWMIMRGVIMGVFQNIQENIKFIIDLETAMTRIKIVGKGTAEEYKTLQTSLVSLASAYGTTASEAADAAVIFAQQGRTVRETIELTRAAMLASKILGTDIKTAVDDMTAAIEGFQLGISDATSIVDKWINVERQFAVTSKDLAEATKVAGASAHQLGMTMSEFLGDVTAIVEVTRKSGAEAARGLSFIYARLLTSGKETIEQIAKVPFYLDATGKATNVIGTQMRDVSDIIGDLAGKWDTLTVAERLQIATSLGSKRQMVALYALMQNYNASIGARIAALTAAGQAEKAFYLTLDTTATKLKQLTAAWNVLTNALVDVSPFKATLSFFDKLILGWANIIDAEKGYAAIYAREINKMQLANETRLNEVKSLKELLSLRKELAAAPQTVENVESLKTVSDAIDVILAKEHKIKVALEVGDSNKFTKLIDDVIKQREREKIRLNVSLEFEPKIWAVKDEIEKLRQLIVGMEEVPGGRLIREDLLKKVRELKNLYKDQDKAIDDQYKSQKGQEEIQKRQLQLAEETLGMEEDGESLSSKLTDKEKEKIQIQSRLNIAKQLGLLTSQQLLDLEIEFTKNSKFSLGGREQELKLLELESERSVAILTDLKTKMGYMSTILGIANENESVIIRQEMASKRMMYGEDYIKNSMDDRLKLAQALTKEADEQEKSSSRLIELFKIAQKYGRGVAQEVSQFLGGMKEFSALSPEAIKALKRVTPSEYEKGIATEYFKPTGFQFPEQIEKERIQARNVRILQNVMVEPISINVRLESEQVIDRVKKEIIKELDNKKSELSTKIGEQIGSF